YVAERSINQGSTAILGCADPVNRSLKSYFPDVAEPPGNDSASTAKWLEALIGHVLREKISGWLTWAVATPRCTGWHPPSQTCSPPSMPAASARWRSIPS